jgi:predicted acetyltransferase
VNLILRELSDKDEAAFMAGMKEWVGESPHWYSFAWKEGMTYPEMMQILRNEAKGVNMAPGRVQHSMLYGFVGGEIIGRLSVRHVLNDYLRKRGGHIGYAVAPRFRKKGYATEMVRQGMKFCRRLGLTEIMVTCSDTNVPSCKIIENFGGRLQDTVWDDEDNDMRRRYWIKL